MIEFKGAIYLYEIDKKKGKFITTGFKPQFDFGTDSQKTGYITILEKEKLFPGEMALVQIKFIDDQFMNNHKEFLLYDGLECIGEGILFTQLPVV